MRLTICWMVGMTVICMSILSGYWVGTGDLVHAQAGTLPPVERYDWAAVGVTPEMQAAFVSDPEAVAYSCWQTIMASNIQYDLDQAYPGKYNLQAQLEAAAVDGPRAGAFAYLEARGDSLGLRDSDPQFFVALDTIKLWAQVP